MFIQIQKYKKNSVGVFLYSNLFMRLLKALVWPVAVYGCESWTLRTADEKRIQAFEMRGLRQTLRVSWTAKRTNDWVYWMKPKCRGAFWNL